MSDRSNIHSIRSVILKIIDTGYKFILDLGVGYSSILFVPSVIRATLNADDILLKLHDSWKSRIQSEETIVYGPKKV